MGFCIGSCVWSGVMVSCWGSSIGYLSPSSLSVTRNGVPSSWHFLPLTQSATTSCTSPFPKRLSSYSDPWHYQNQENYTSSSPSPSPSAPSVSNYAAHADPSSSQHTSADPSN